MKFEINHQGVELAAQSAAFAQIARTAARFFSAGCGAVTLRIPDGIVFIGRHGIPVRSLQQKNNLGKHANKPQIFKNLRKTRIKAFRQLSQLHGGIAFFACAPIHDFHMNSIGLVSVGDETPMDHPAEKLVMLQDLAKIAFEHLVLLLQTQDCPMHADGTRLRPTCYSAGPATTAIDVCRPTGPAHTPCFEENKSPDFNEEPVSNFLIRTLIPKRQLSHRKDVTYFTVKTWKKSIKDAQISALRALKEFGSDELAALAADDVKSALEGLLGTLDFDFVTAIPCMHSKRDACFSNLIGQKISSSTGVPFKECFKREYRAGSSHPANNPRLPPYKLTEPVHGKILLIDDVATSGTHIEKAAKRLRENGSSVFSVAWIGNA